MMAEYIERKAAIKFVKENTPHFDGETTMQCVEWSLVNVPAVDVVEVVRCGKCKCYEEMRSENARFCNRFGGYVTEHDYCSRAEKKEGVTNA